MHFVFLLVSGWLSTGAEMAAEAFFERDVGAIGDEAMKLDEGLC
jgi:hypothetical protein